MAKLFMSSGERGRLELELGIPNTAVLSAVPDSEGNIKKPTLILSRSDLMVRLEFYDNTIIGLLIQELTRLRDEGGLKLSVDQAEKGEPHPK